jgi:hypothetical protein
MKKILLIASVLFSVHCKQQSVVSEYMVTYKNGIAFDTVLTSKEFYDSSNKLTSAYQYFSEKVARRYTYFYKAQNIEEIKSKRDNVVYILKNKGIVIEYMNGKIISETYYNSHNDITKIVSYNTQNKASVISVERYKYIYAKNGKLLSASHIFNDTIIDKASYKYKNGILVEKFYDYNKCCEGNQPIPPDKIMYKNFGDNIKIEYRITDNSIKRNYNKQMRSQYNQVHVTKFVYDSKGRIIKKELFSPNYMDASNANFKFLNKETLMECYYYKYE